MEEYSQSPVTEQTPVLPGVRSLFKRSFRVFQEKSAIFLKLIGLLLIVYGITVLSSTLGGVALIIAGIGFLALFIFGTIVTIASIYVVKEREQDISVREALNKGTGKLLSYIWLSVLNAFIVLGGFIFFFIPGILFSIWFSLAVFILVAEDRGGFSALFRSKQLVEGTWWSVVRRFSVLWLFSIATSIIVVLIPTIVLSLIVGEGTFNSKSDPTAGVSFFFALALQTWNFFISILIAFFGVIYSFLLYEDLKAYKGNPLFERPSASRKLKYIAIALLGTLIIPVVLIAVIVLSVTQALR